MRLADTYQGRKDVQVFPGAHHNDISGQPVGWWKAVFGFWGFTTEPMIGDKHR